MKKILYLEDDGRTLFETTEALEFAGYSVTGVKLISEFLSQVELGRFDLWIMDRMIEAGGRDNVDSHATLRKLKHEGHTTTVLVLSGERIDPNDELQSLGLADEFMRKGSGTDVLIQRVDKVLKAAQTVDPAVTQKGNWLLNTDYEVIFYRGQKPALTADEYAFVKLLFDYYDINDMDASIVPDEVLIDTLFEKEVEGTNTLSARKSRTNKKFQAIQLPQLIARSTSKRLNVKGYHLVA